MKGRIGYDRLLIERFSRAIAGFNHVSLNLTSLYEHCQDHRFRIIEKPLRKLHGCCFHLEGIPFLSVNSLLPESERVIAGWHEFCHLLDQPATPSVFCSTGDLWNSKKAERQAQTIGLIALMPDAEIVGMCVEDLMGNYNISRKLAFQRFEIAANY